MFYTLILELVALSIGFFGNYLSFDSREAKEKVANYIEKEVEERVTEKLSKQQFYAEKFSWKGFNDWFLEVKDQFQLEDRHIDAYKAAAIHQLMWRNEFKLIYDEYTYHYKLEFDESGSYTVTVTSYTESNAVLDYFEEEGIQPSRNLLNEVYNALNTCSYYENSILVPDYVIRIYRNEKMGYRFVKELKKE